MAKNPNPRITPYLFYEDVGTAVEWLRIAFGLKPFGETFVGEGGKVNHAAMRLGKGAVMMGYPGPQYRNPRKVGAVTQNLYVRVRDVDEHFERARDAGAKILEEPADTPYGHRRYGAEDLEGHVWYFAEVLKGKKAKRRRAEKRQQGRKRKKQPVKQATAKKRRSAR